MKDAVRKRQIEWVWHFTRLENLHSILSSGIIPRARLEANAVNVNFNDPHRMDGEKEANCLSISHPNYKLFYSLRQQLPQEEWVALACDSTILWLKDCAFCYENAASTNVKAIPVSSRKGLVAFESLFCAAEGKPSREELELTDDYPTNPQAEVLVFEAIEPKHIISVVCNDRSLKKKLSIKYPLHKFSYDQTPFSPRTDHAYWK